ncbi:unnamed protein product [Durusdinium trenchii]|uniref:Hexosyltransferase n=1 Tax=Durusdinium trenchii TaxID=1381693 RepID=A0ABP0MG94_9DINO
MRREMEEHNDLVFLPVTEGYRMNSRKGLLFLEWIAARAEAEFLLKTDDDVYLRPTPLLRQLERRIPAQYAWAIFDYISPVPRDEDDNFYNPEETFPFPVFPPYPRGVVRVLSMDVVRLLAKASQEAAGHRGHMVMRFARLSLQLAQGLKYSFKQGRIG